MAADLVTRGPYQLPSTDEAKADGAAGMVSSATNAEKDYPGFRYDATVFVVAYLEAHGIASCEALTIAAKNAGIIPHHDTAFGTVYNSLSKWNVTVKVGEEPRKRGHNAPGARVYMLQDGWQKISLTEVATPAKERKKKKKNKKGG
jgi:hypothetical protein